jgi:hypothetical protein
MNAFVTPPGVASLLPKIKPQELDADTAHEPPLIQLRRSVATVGLVPIVQLTNRAEPVSLPEFNQRLHRADQGNPVGRVGNDSL